jgi:predicted kinase
VVAVVTPAAAAAPADRPRTAELVVFVGLQAAGKSSFYRERFAATHVLVSKDLLRNNRKPQRRQLRLVEEALARGRSVVVDNTNPTAAERAPLVTLGRGHGARIVGYYFPAPLTDCLVRNAGREGRARVPSVALYATARKLERPRRTEGFDALFQVRLTGPAGFEVAVMEEAREDT